MKTNAEQQSNHVDVCEVYVELNYKLVWVYLNCLPDIVKPVADRTFWFLQTYRNIDRCDLQLAGMTCMWVACKYEEITFPEVSDFVYIADNTYTSSQIIAMETKILDTLEFNLGRPLPIHFLRRFSKVAQSSPTTHTLAKYFMELTIIEYEVCHAPPSLVAASSLFLALWLVHGEQRTVWSPSLEYYSEYTVNDILPVATQMAGYIVAAPSSKYQATHKKFASPKLLQISKHPVLKSAELTSIANSTSTF